MPYIPDWNKKIGGFFQARNSFEPMDDKICKEKIDSILEELQYAITDIRSGESLPIKWKSKSDKTTLKLY